MPETKGANRYRFDDLKLDAGQRRVTRGKDPLPISTLTFDFLLALVESWPNVVSYEELLESVWSGRCVSHETVSQRVLMLRKAIGDDAEHPRYIEVIRGHGCRLIPAVEPLQSRWTFQWNRTRYALASGLAGLVVASGYWTYSVSSLAPPLPTADERLEALPPENSEVRALYSRALDFWRDSGTRSLRITNVDPAIHTYLDRVIELEPEFSMAYGLKARAYADSLITPFPIGEDLAALREEQERLAWSYAEEALSLSPETSVAHLAIAKIHQHNYRREDARAAYRRALDADAEHIGILHAAALFHAYAGENAEAINLARGAVAADHNHPISLYQLGVVHAFSGNIDLAVDALKGAVELDPAYAAPRVWLGHMELIRGNRDAAETAFQMARPIILQRHPPRLMYLAQGFAKLGMNDDAEGLIDRFMESSADWHFGPVHWAIAHLVLGDKETALDSLRAASETRGPDHGFILEMIVKANVFRDETLDEPEFVDIRSNLGFQD